MKLHRRRASDMIPKPQTHEGLLRGKERMPMKETDVPILSDSKPLTVGLPPSEPVVKSATNGTEPMSRRQAMQWVMAAVAASALPRQGFAQAKPESEKKSV